MTRDEAVSALQRSGIPVEPDRIFRYIEAGDVETVKAFLAAGIHPNVVDSLGRRAIVVAAASRRKDVAAELLRAGADPLDLVDAAAPLPRAKDRWEKLASLAGVLTFTSSLVIAAVGWYFTSTYNERQTELQRQSAARDSDIKIQQNRLVEMQTIEKMIPHLAADERNQRAALLAIQELASPQLASRLAELFAGPGSIAALTTMARQQETGAKAEAVSALASIASSGSAPDAAAALRALGDVFDGKQQSLVTVNSRQGTSELGVCSGFLAAAGIKRLVVTASYCATDMKLSSITTSNKVKLPITVVRAVAEEPVALLAVQGNAPPSLEIAPQSPPAASKVVAIGFSGGERLIAVPGIVRGEKDQPDANGKTRRLLQIDYEADVTGGTGGGPILDGTGRVACMIYMGTGKQEFCVPAPVIAASLRAVTTAN